MRTFDLSGVPGVPETALTDPLLATLPDNLAPAPWAVRCSALVWWGRAGDEATAALPPALRERASAQVVVGGLVRYEDTPVGAYDEVFGVVGYRLGRSVGSNVAFMAVDSPASLVGGRTNWSMPKTMATFEGAPEGGATFGATGDLDSAWTVSATAGRLGPPLPVLSRARVLQQFPDGSLRGSRLSARGWMRPTRV
ncbi:acetoacetate decarboxylase family protein, partial [Nocardioides sp.]|uniref:acetoacetate decarboxylase family protein n=1 Tax=Nocardioides sp. TaxID=35761 RepID=UPI002734868F